MEIDTGELFQIIGQKEYVNQKLQAEIANQKEINKNLTEQLKQED